MGVGMTVISGSGVLDGFGGMGVWVEAGVVAALQLTIAKVRTINITGIKLFVFIGSSSPNNSFWKLNFPW
jgi:hypothetical protein